MEQKEFRYQKEIEDTVYTVIVKESNTAKETVLKKLERARKSYGQKLKSRMQFHRSKSMKMYSSVQQHNNSYLGGEKITALYCRLSSDDGSEGDSNSNSIVNQKAILGKYASEKGFPTPQFYVDNGYSGTNFNRPDFQRMMSDVDAGLVTTVIVKDMSRLGRDYLKVGLYTEITFPDAGVRFIAINDGVDSESNVDNDFTPFRNIINERYAKDTSKKIRAVFKAKGMSGKHLGSIPPYGYKKDETDKQKWS